jgi:multicomponent Na+:H+ antiporter subunit B
MNSVILRTIARGLMPLLLLFSVFLFVRGHNQPGGGFAGGLVAAAAFALHSIAYSVAEARQALRIETRLLVGIGLLAALASGVLGLLAGRPFLTGLWGYVSLPGVERLDVGTPLLFDLGVYLAVMGVTLTIVFALEEAD